ncbi:putative aldolase class 2 protein PA3430 [Apostichopus japonicus]|uniref:putative aldolase class 2 protein PA3430 n=1 Tax=Stichopus japonicus TaxID=307972 RepID=UPI003AB4F4FD
MATLVSRSLPRLRSLVLLSRCGLPGISRCQWQSTASKSNQSLSEVIKENYAARVELAVAYRAMEYYNMHEGVCNHLSLRAPAKDGNGDVMLLLRYGTHWSQVTASTLIGVDFESGEVIEGVGPVEMSAMNIHRAIHKVKAADGIKCVMHNHQPYTTALACVKGGRLKNIHQNSMIFHNRISYDLGYGGIPDCDESEHIAKAFDGKNICILGNHGVAAVGTRVCDVFNDLYYLERAAMVQVLAMSTGKELWEVSDEIATEVANFDFTSYAEAHFNSMKSVLAKVEPDYKS